MSKWLKRNRLTRLTQYKIQVGLKKFKLKKGNILVNYITFTHSDHGSDNEKERTPTETETMAVTMAVKMSKLYYKSTIDQAYLEPK